MPKANRTCHCCGKKYYYCTSCPDDRRDPQVYVMWDSERCKEIFTILTNEAVGKLSTLDCKNKLIELGVNKNTEFAENVKVHVQRVFECEDKKEEEKNVLNTKNVNKKTVAKKDSNVEEVSKLEGVEKQIIEEDKEPVLDSSKEKIQEKNNIKRTVKSKAKTVSEK